MENMQSILIGVAGVVLLLTTVHCQDSDGPVVQVVDGLLQGASRMDRFNRTYDVFHAVPYAQPPVGDLRWKPAQRPVNSWTGIRNATEFAPHCIQVIASAYRFMGLSSNDSEDCLYLNVYVPVSVEDALETNLPVIFYLFGGAYLIGTSEMYPPQELVTEQNVIIVMPNFRISILGFFSTGDEAAPGNYGLWDGKAALEWTVENIAAFGGKPNDITIIGHSAGAAMAMHFVLAPHTNNMFQKAIIMSGSATGSMGTNLQPMKTTQRLSDLFFCNTTDSFEIVDCLMKVDAKSLDTMSLAYLSINQSMVPDFMPVIDGDFINQDPRQSIQEGVGGHIHVMTGYVYHDGAGFALGIPMGYPPIAELPRLNRSDDGNSNSEDIREDIMHMFGGTDDPEKYYNILLDRYPELNSTDDEICSKKAAEVLTYGLFSAAAHSEASSHARASSNESNTFVYRVEYVPSILTGYPDWVNGSHLDMIYLVLGDPFLREFRDNVMSEPDFSPEDELVGKSIRSRFGNFAYTGNPNEGPTSQSVVWPTYDEHRQFIIQSTQDRIGTLTPEELDEINWFNNEFWPLMRPLPDNSTEVNTPEAQDLKVDAVNEETFRASIEDNQYKLYGLAGWVPENMDRIDETFQTALNDREKYRPS